MMNKFCTGIILALLFSISTVLPENPIELKPEGYFETPGFAFLVYHNDYLVGKRGGLQMFLHGRRVMDAGEVVCSAGAGRVWDFDDQQMGERVVSIEKGFSMIPGRFRQADIGYRLICRSDGDSILLTVELDKPFDWKRFSNIAFKMEIYPGEYRYKTYMGRGVLGSFVERYMGEETLIPQAEEIVIAPEDRHRSFKISSQEAILSLRDARGRGSINGFMVTAVLPAKSDKTQFSLRITPRIDPDWRRDPVIQVSQVGYHPKQKKRAVLELDARTGVVEEVKISLLSPSGSTVPIKSEKPKRWGAMFDYLYYIFDFSDIDQPGQYYLTYNGQETGPICIDPALYQRAWRPTMDVFFPVQMCHVEVRQGEKVWHGACHLDDGMQAPPNTVHFDSYVQNSETETGFEANEHIPGLNWGGWHDAGDNDLPFGSICQTVNWIALAHEEFDASRDVTSIRKKQRRVNLFQRDGKNDILQQVSYGMECLLGLYHAAGHVCPGIIENNMLDYTVVGDPVNITDGFVFDRSLKPDEKREGRSGKADDRWVFTNRNTGGQYQFVQTAAIASRVLADFDANLAKECLNAAKDVWSYEQDHAPVHFEVCYSPLEDEFHSWELMAAAELYLTTGKPPYKKRLLELIPEIKSMPVRAFWMLSGSTLVRALEKVGDAAFTQSLVDKLEDLKTMIEKEYSHTPYGVSSAFPPVWGNNWDVLDFAARNYYFIKNFPDLFKEDYLYDAINYNFGCHPASNHSYVSGVGINSATVGYGFNRSDWTYIPGGVVSGASFIRPKFIEYRSGAWDWYETEYVISGSAAFVFDVLAADHLLNHKH